MLVMSLSPALMKLGVLGVVLAMGVVAFVLALDRPMVQTHDWGRANALLTWRLRHPVRATIRKTLGFVGMMLLILPVLALRKLTGR